MARKSLRELYTKEALEFFRHVVEEKPLLPFLVPLALVSWAVERWLVPFSNWVPLAIVAWAMIQLVLNLPQKGTVLGLITAPSFSLFLSGVFWTSMEVGVIVVIELTPLEPCQWLNKLLMEVWPNYIEPKLSQRFRHIVEVTLLLLAFSANCTSATHQKCTMLRRRCRPCMILSWLVHSSTMPDIDLMLSIMVVVEEALQRKKILEEGWGAGLPDSDILSCLITKSTAFIQEKIELLEFALGSCPPSIGLQGTHWLTSGDQRFMRMGFDWDTNDMSIMLHAKLAKPLGTARIIINSIHIKGDLFFMPIIDGQAILYSFESTPEVRIGVAFGSGGSQNLPATELPGVSSWLVKLVTEMLVKTMVEPHRRCYPLPPIDLRKKAVGGVLYVTVVSASDIVGNIKGSSPERRQNCRGSNPEGSSSGRGLETLVEVELGELTRRTDVRQGSCPRWDTTFNMILHDNVGILKFHLYEWAPNNVKYDHLTSCEVKMMYSPDDSTIFWAVGRGSIPLAKHVEDCGKEVEMVIPFEGINPGELTVKLVLREWQFSDGSNSLKSSHLLNHQPSTYGSSNFESKTGRKLKLTVVEGRDLATKAGKCDPYVKLQYGKNLLRTKAIQNSANPVWNEKFEFDEIESGECLKIKCYSADIFGDDGIGSAQVNLEGLSEGTLRDAWIPLEKVNTGELRLQIETAKTEGERSRNGMVGSRSGWIELVLVEAKDLIAADLNGTSDPYVRVQYGNVKKRTKVVYKTLNPQWNQTLEFPDNGSPLVLHVRDHNALLPTSGIGDCVVEYDRLPPNQMADKWIPLQGVKRGEIHIQITRRAPELGKRSSLDADISDFSKANQISSQVKQVITKFRSLVEEGDLEGLSLTLSEMEGAEDMRGGYMVQLEREKSLLINKINELDREINKVSSSSSRKM
ncbi:hypothetical protein ACLOJK_032983 [Asimina triloba]